MLRAEEAEGKIKTNEQEILRKDQEITSLQHRLKLAEQDLDNTEAKLKEAKGASAEHDASKSANEAQGRKIQLLEEELDRHEKSHGEAVERCANAVIAKRRRPLTDCGSRYRQADIRAEHFERQVKTLEQERDQWEKKYEVRQSNQWPFTTHIPSIYRRLRKCINNPRKSSTSS